MAYWYHLLDRVVVTACGRRLSTLQDVAEFASFHRHNHRWNYAAECARLAALSREPSALRDATIAAQNAVLLDHLTTPNEIMESSHESAA